MEPTATTDGGYDTVSYCTRCGAELSREHTTLPATGATTYYTVSFSVPSGVAAVSAMTVEAGGTVTLPTAGAPSGYTFLGWVTSTVSNATEQPTTYSGNVTVNGNVTLYALYSYTATSGGSTVTAYELLGSAPTTWAGNYLITYGTSTSSLYVLKGLSGNKSYESTSAGGSVSAAASAGSSRSTARNLRASTVFPSPPSSVTSSTPGRVRLGDGSGTC